MSDYDEDYTDGQSSNGSAYADDDGNGGGTYMQLREASQRRRPGRFREPDEIPNPGRPAWVHPNPVFNPFLARFVSQNTVPLGHQGPDSRARYRQWLDAQGINEEELLRRLESGEVRSAAICSAFSSFREVSEDPSQGPTVTNLPPLGEHAQVSGNDGMSNLDVDDSSESGSENGEPGEQISRDGTTRVSLSFNPISHLPLPAIAFQCNEK